MCVAPICLHLLQALRDSIVRTLFDGFPLVEDSCGASAPPAPLSEVETAAAATTSTSAAGIAPGPAAGIVLPEDKGTALFIGPQPKPKHR